VIEHHLTLLDELDRFQQLLEQRLGPAATALIKSSIGELKHGRLEEKIARPGTAFPACRLLKDSHNKSFDLAALVALRAAVIFFYRGSWCPFCKLTLRAFNDARDVFTMAGVSLIGISPELPAYAAEVAEKHGLAFSLLSDTDGKLMRKLGISYVVPEGLRPLFEKNGHSLAERNGNDSWELPLTSAFVVTPPGLIKNRFVSPDYTKRTELAAALADIKCPNADFQA
jgi:peroxiredoxin